MGLPVSKWQVKQVDVEDRTGGSAPLGWIVVRTMSDGTLQAAGPGTELHFAKEKAAAQAFADQLNAVRQREVDNGRITGLCEGNDTV